MDRGTKYLLGAAAGLGGLLLAGMVGWALTGGHSTAVPVIEADTRPIRVKPDNPGGLQVTGADEQVMGGQGSKVQGMAPAAEVPAPEALRAQVPPQAPSQTPSQTRAPAVPPPADTQPAAAAPSPPPAAPPRPAAPVQAARPATAPATGTVVQLAAVDSEQVAQSEWQRLAKRMPELLGDRRPILQRVEHDGRAVWRVRTGGFADIAEATSFCARVRSKGGSCALGNF